MSNFRYQSLGPLPSAGTSRAFLGLAIRDESRAEPVVLVWVPEELAQDVEKSERIQRETERAALLDHPHIIRVYGFARMEGGRLARVVEFGDGENLGRVLNATGPLPAPLASRLVADAAQGVHYAHLAGNDDGTPLIHGDLRPETLLVAFSGNCKVSGYGAAAFAAKQNRGRNIRVAPEQVLGGRGAMNVQTDVYLLGATLFEALTGKAPFEDEADVDQAVLTKELDFSQWPQVTPELVPILSRALAKKAADRFPSALLLREALELSVQPLPDEAEVSQWLGGHFPDADGTRAARQRLIDAGIAAFARAQWAKQEPSSNPRFPTVAPPPPELGIPQRAFTPSQPNAAVTATPAVPGATGSATAHAGSSAQSGSSTPGRTPAAPTTPGTSPTPSSTVPSGAPSQTAPGSSAPSPSLRPAPARASVPSGGVSLGGEVETTAEFQAMTRAKRRKSALPFLIFGVLAAVAIAGLYALSKRAPVKEPVIGTTPTSNAITDAGERIAVTPPVANLADGGGAIAATGATTDAGVAVAVPAADGGAAPTQPGATGSTGVATATPPAITGPKGTLSLTSDPTASVEIDGVPSGHTPLRISVAAGKRRVHLVDKNKGVDITRVVTVPENGTASEEIYLQKGFVSVNAPVGALIDIDGKRVGKAPLTTDVSLYEGAHKVEVTIGTQKWREAFTVKANQRVYFDVGPQYQ